MAEITAALVKELREKSGAGMMDCKKALQENNGDIDLAIDWLRTKGLSKAAKKSDRAAAEGLVGAAVRKDGAGMTGVVVELNAETDFVARNELFQKAAKEIAGIALDQDGVEAISAAKTAGGETVADMVTNLIATIGENMNLRRAHRFVVPEGVVASYVHSAIVPDLGKIGVLVAVEGKGDQAQLAEMGRKIAMHVAATNPLSLSTDDLDPAAVEREKAMQLVAETAKATGSPVSVKGFVRFALGEGVEKKVDDFAAEVASMSGQG